MNSVRDPAELTYFSNLFTSIAEEMGVTLTRTAFSPNIKERKDFSCALYDAKGELVAQASHIPVHLGAMPVAVEAVRNAFPVMEEGEAYILNDPFQGGTHLPDITMVSPVILNEGNAPVAYLASRAHHADIGGMSPGSLPLSRENFQEGLCIPPVLLHSRSGINRDVLNMIMANVRTPIERRGDLQAQLAAHDTGERRVVESFEKYGTADLALRMKEVRGYARKLMTSVIRRIPDGSYAFSDFLDDDGINLSQQLGIQVEVQIRNGKVIVDFSGSADQCAGSLNAVRAITHSAVYYCFMCLVATTSSLGRGIREVAMLNGGCFEPISIKIRQGSLLDACPGAAVAGGNVETSQRIVDVVFGALSKAVPDLIPAASQGTMNNLTLGGTAPDGTPFVYYETIAGGMGARPGADGLSGIHTHMTNTLNTPVEALEYAYPLRVVRYALSGGKGGRGKYRGGRGVVREMEALCEMEGTLLTDRRMTAPYGLKSGTEGESGKNSLIRDGKAQSLPSKLALHLDPGDILRISTPGGGGFGRSEKARSSRSKK